MIYSAEFKATQWSLSANRQCSYLSLTVGSGSSVFGISVRFVDICFVSDDNFGLLSWVMKHDMAKKEELIQFDFAAGFGKIWP